MSKYAGHATEVIGVFATVRFFVGQKTPMPSPMQTPITVAAQTRPLVMRCGGFGEVVLLTALLEQLHARFGRPVDVISSGPWAEPLLQGLDAVAEVRALHSRNTPYWINPSQQRLVDWLRQRGAGPTWFCDAHDAGRELLRRAGIPDSYVCDSRLFAGIDGEHFVDRWIRFANVTPQAFDGLLPHTAIRVCSTAKLPISAAADAAFREWLKQKQLPESAYFVIQAGNKRNTRGRVRGWIRNRPTNTKHWPETHWAQLLRAVRDLYPHHAILLLGVRQEYSLNADIARLANIPHVYNLAGDLPVPILLPLLRGARGMFSVDTGPAHAAAALGCPTVALFGMADPRLYRPGGVATPAMALTGELDGQRNILGISVDSVVSAWLALMQSRPVITGQESQ